MAEDTTVNMEDEKVSVVALVVDQTTDSQTTSTSTEKISEVTTEKILENSTEKIFETTPEKMAENVATEMNKEMDEYYDDSVFSDMADQQTTQDSSIEGWKSLFSKGLGYVWYYKF